MGVGAGRIVCSAYNRKFGTLIWFRCLFFLIRCPYLQLRVGLGFNLGLVGSLLCFLMEVDLGNLIDFTLRVSAAFGVGDSRGTFFFHLPWGLDEF